MDYNYREAMRLVNQLCFPLYAAARNVTGLYTPWLKPLGLTYTQYSGKGAAGKSKGHSPEGCGVRRPAAREGRNALHAALRTAGEPEKQKRERRKQR